MRRLPPILALALLVAVVPRLHAQTYVFFNDFNAATNSATQTWSYYSGINVAIRDGRYQLADTYNGNTFGAGLQSWSTAGTSYGNLGINSSGSAYFGLPSGSGWVHPEQNGAVALGFRAPFSGTFSVSWTIANTEAGGDGVDWFLDRGTTNLASGIRTFADGNFSGSLTTNLVSGEFLYFVVGRNGSSYLYDTTRLDLAVVAVPEPPALLGLIIGLGVLTQVMRHRRETEHNRTT